MPQCSPTAVSGFLRLRSSFILVASVLPVSSMYVRGHSGHSTWYTRPHFCSSGVLSLECTRMDPIVLMSHGKCPPTPCALNKPVSASEVHVDVVLCCCLGFRTLKIHCFIHFLTDLLLIVYILEEKMETVLKCTDNLLLNFLCGLFILVKWLPQVAISHWNILYLSNANMLIEVSIDLCIQIN